jgi:hypothetical protein
VSNNSSTGGYISQTATAPTINHLIHDQIAGILGLDNTLVRPKNQPSPPPPPAFGTDWVGFGSSQVKTDGFAHIGSDGTLTRQENFQVTVSIYGSNADSNARKLRDSLEVAQNWETMSGLKFMGSTQYIRVPELHNGRWLQRYDFTYNVSQNAENNYSILSLDGLSGISIIDK